MGKLLNPLVVILLLLSIVALVLGIMLFSDREIVKGRVQKLETAVVDVADAMADEKDPHIEPLDYQVQKQSLMDYEKMDQQLNTMKTIAKVRYDDLFETEADLDKTEKTLVKTEGELKDTKEELNDTRAEVDRLEEDVAQKTREIDEAGRRIDTLEQDKASMQVQMDELNATIVQAQETIQEKQDEIDMLEETLARTAPDEGTVIEGPPEGLTGHVLVVNPYWNFVVLDIGREAGLQATHEMIVHRDDRLVGRVRVSSVEDNMAVAEILNDWEQVPIREGDYVLF